MLATSERAGSTESDPTFKKSKAKQQAKHKANSEEGRDLMKKRITRYPGMSTRIRARRLDMGYTQQDLADKTSVTKSAVSLWEKPVAQGGTEPSGRRLERLAATLRCSVAHLTGSAEGGDGSDEGFDSNGSFSEIENVDLREYVEVLPFQVRSEVDNRGGNTGGHKTVNTTGLLTLKIPTEILTSAGLKATQVRYYINHNSSMSPMLPIGSTVAVNVEDKARGLTSTVLADNEIKDGGLYLYSLKGDYLDVGYLYDTPLGVRVRKVNSTEYPDQTMNRKDLFIEGSVIWYSVSLV